MILATTLLLVACGGGGGADGDALSNLPDAVARVDRGELLDANTENTATNRATAIAISRIATDNAIRIEHRNLNGDLVVRTLRTRAQGLPSCTMRGQTSIAGGIALSPDGDNIRHQLLVLNGNANIKVGPDGPGRRVTATQKWRIPNDAQAVAASGAALQISRARASGPQLASGKLFIGFGSNLRGERDVLQWDPIAQRTVFELYLDRAGDPAAASDVGSCRAQFTP